MDRERLQQGIGYRFSDAGLLNTAVTFNAPGEYILMLSAEDGVHAVAYDAVKITAASESRLSAALAGNDFQLSWNLPPGQSVIEQKLSFSTAWMPVLTTAVQTATLPITNSAAFFRIRQP